MNGQHDYELIKDFYFQLLERLTSKHSFARKGLLQHKRKIFLPDASVIPYDWDLSNLVTFIRLNLFVKVDLQKWLDQPFYTSSQQDANDQLSIFDG